MKRINVWIKGITPLLMHSNEGVNPLHPLAKAKKEITSKRKKTDDDHLEILRLQWEMGLYLDKDGKPMIPSINVEATIRDAAKKEKKGKEVISGLVVTPDDIPLIYPGPQDKKGLWDQRRPDGSAMFSDVRIATIDRSRVPICRPRFDSWQLKFAIEYSENDFSDDEVKRFLQVAGEKVGLCDYRPKFGKFALVSMEPGS